MIDTIGVQFPIYEGVNTDENKYAQKYYKEPQEYKYPPPSLRWVLREHFSERCGYWFGSSL